MDWIKYVDTYKPPYQSSFPAMKRPFLEEARDAAEEVAAKRPHLDDEEHFSKWLQVLQHDHVMAEPVLARLNAPDLWAVKQTNTWYTQTIAGQRLINDVWHLKACLAFRSPLVPLPPLGECTKGTYTCVSHWAFYYKSLDKEPEAVRYRFWEAAYGACSAYVALCSMMVQAMGLRAVLVPGPPPGAPRNFYERMGAELTAEDSVIHYASGEEGIAPGTFWPFLGRADGDHTEARRWFNRTLSVEWEPAVRVQDAPEDIQPRSPTPGTQIDFMYPTVGTGTLGRDLFGVLAADGHTIVFYDETRPAMRCHLHALSVKRPTWERRFKATVTARMDMYCCDIDAMKAATDPRGVMHFVELITILPWLLESAPRLGEFKAGARLNLLQVRVSLTSLIGVQAFVRDCRVIPRPKEDRFTSLYAIMRATHMIEPGHIEPGYARNLCLGLIEGPALLWHNETRARLRRIDFRRCVCPGPSTHVNLATGEELCATCAALTCHGR